jgi:hypothetical protein
VRSRQCTSFHVVSLPTSGALLTFLRSWVQRLYDVCSSKGWFAGQGRRDSPSTPSHPAESWSGISEVYNASPFPYQKDNNEMIANPNMWESQYETNFPSFQVPTPTLFTSGNLISPHGSLTLIFSPFEYERGPYLTASRYLPNIDSWQQRTTSQVCSTSPSCYQGFRVCLPRTAFATLCLLAWQNNFGFGIMFFWNGDQLRGLLAIK